jgi:hypothetical protein
MFYLSWDDLWKASFPQINEALHNMLQHDPIETHHFATFGAGAFRTWARTLLDPHNATPSVSFTGILSIEERCLACLLELFLHADCHAAANHTDQFPMFQHDLDFVVEIMTDDKPRVKMFRLKAERANVDQLHYCFCLIALKLFLAENFKEIVHDREDATEAAFLLMKKKALASFLRTDLADFTVLGNIGLVNTHFANCLSATTLSDFMRELQRLQRVQGHNVNHHASVVHVACPSIDFITHECNVRFLASDLLLLRPCIEHYMLAVILGRGGGPEELGATFWGQTELSCYDDSQHGNWGMSYKYHERAIVTNERNLIRVYDVCFDGYCGGNDAAILGWTDTALSDFKRKAGGLTDPYTCPSMIVMALPPKTDSLDAFPNPLVLHRVITAIPAYAPDRGLRSSSNGIEDHAPFLTKKQTLQGHVYALYHHALGMHEWTNTHQAAGHLAYQNETDPYMFSFHGHMATLLDGQREETQGSGHLGPNFVGVASVREERGMMQRGQLGCVNRAQIGGRCVRHGAVTTRCSEWGCVHRAKSRGRCFQHGGGLRCPHCITWIDSQVGNPDYDNYCATCFKHLWPDDPRSKLNYEHTKELAMRQAIKQDFEGFAHDKQLERSHCDCTMRRRIDCRKNINGTLLAVEYDEFAHRRYDQEDEKNRYYDIMMSHGGKRIFIRFNPDLKGTSREQAIRMPTLAHLV